MRWIEALLEFEPAALDALETYIAIRENANAQRLTRDEGPDLYRAQGAIQELNQLRATITNAVAEARHQPDMESSHV